MNELLKSIVEKVKEDLISEPDSIIYGELNDGNKNINSDDNHLKEHYDFLRICDGARCGAIDLWSYDELSLHQSRVSNFLGGTEKWVEVGQVLYEPLVIEKESGLIYCFHQGHPAKIGQTLGSFNYFMLNYVFGKKYEELIPDSHLEDWYQYLKRIGLA
ncbi:hypothetical protein [Bacillus sp. Hm123]|uniref:hypothetical protein n=1 Tax=Bacillus sp. Hm123 TaxID=3450745 RepID=UPI003F43A21E